MLLGSRSTLQMQHNHNPLSGKERCQGTVLPQQSIWRNEPRFVQFLSLGPDHRLILQRLVTILTLKADMSVEPPVCQALC